MSSFFESASEVMGLFFASGGPFEWMCQTAPMILITGIKYLPASIGISFILIVTAKLVRLRKRRIKRSVRSL